MKRIALALLIVAVVAAVGITVWYNNTISGLPTVTEPPNPGIFTRGMAQQRQNERETVRRNYNSGLAISGGLAALALILFVASPVPTSK